MRKITKITSLIAAVLVFLSLAAGVYALTVPEPSNLFYVYDETGKMSEETKQRIVNANDSLSSQCGAQIVVAFVQTTGTASISEYAKDMFNEWKIGDKEKNNGVLILFALKDDDYYILQGKGLEKTLSSGYLKLLLNDYTEPEFAKGNYDVAASKTFDQLIKHFETAYNIKVDYSASSESVSESETETEKVKPDEGEKEDEGIGKSLLGILFTTFVIPSIALIIIGLIIAAAVIAIVKIAKSSGGKGPGPGGTSSNKNPYSSSAKKSWDRSDPNAPHSSYKADFSSGSSYSSGAGSTNSSSSSGTGEAPKIDFDKINNSSRKNSSDGYGWAAAGAGLGILGLAKSAVRNAKRSVKSDIGRTIKNAKNNSFGSFNFSSGRCGRSSFGGSTRSSGGFSHGGGSSFKRGGGGGFSRGGGAGRR